MTSPIDSTTRVVLPWYRQASKVVAAVATTGAACVSIFTFLFSYGILGKSESHQTVGNLGVAWVGVRPAVDTATAIGDTVHLAATITDRAGAILVGTRPAWSSENPRVALVGNDGSVVAQGPGATTITVAVGGRIARSRIIVRQHVATVDVIGADGAEGLTLRELDRQPLRARARDARGHAIADVAARWRVDDSTVVALDSTGIATARAPGRTIITAMMDDVVGHAALSVVAVPATIELLAGAGQHAPAGRALAQTMVVRVISRRGLPVSGALVTFRLAEGNGALEPASTLSDADGRARTAWTLGELPGRQSLIATAQHLDSTLVVSAEADPTPANTRAVAVVEHPSGAAAMPLAEAVQLLVTDSSGRVLSDVPVSWHALDGTVEPLGPRTDSAGIARARWTLGPMAGTQRMRAQVGAAHGAAIPPVTISATALAGAAARMIVVSGDRQRGSVGAPLRRPIVVRVLDAAGNGVANAALVVSVASGTLPDSLVRTDASGAAALQWTLGRSAGSHALGVHLDGLKESLHVVALAQPGAPANLAYEVHGSPARTGTRKLVATVTDLYGNPVPNVKLGLTAKGGQVSPSRAVTDGRGTVALTWTPGSGTALSGAIAGTDVRETYALQSGATVQQAGGPFDSFAPGKVKAKARATGRSRSPTK
jgi:hypothetical protein